MDYEFRYVKIQQEEDRFLHINLFCISNKTQYRWICNQYPIIYKMTPSLGNLVGGTLGVCTHRCLSSSIGFCRVHLMPQSTVNKWHCGNVTIPVLVELYKPIQGFAFVTYGAVEIMRANTCTFGFSNYSVKYMYLLALDNKNKILTRFLKLIFLAKLRY